MAVLTEPGETSDPLREALKAFFGLDYLFPYQRLVISNILEAAEARGFPLRRPFLREPAGSPPPDNGESDRGSLGRQIVILPTGAGKSLCFQLPAALLSGTTLVIYPILSLMADQERRLREKGFSPVLLRGNQTAGEREAIWEAIRSGKSRFIIANPEVLLTPPVMEKLPSLGILHLVIDEAHCVSEWGESFRPAYLRIGEIIAAIRGESPASPGEGPLVTAFTATASRDVLEKIEKNLFGGEENVQKIIGNPDRSNIVYSARGTLLKDGAVRDFLTHYGRPALVFCSSRSGAEQLARYLRNSFRDGEVKFYHAGLSREEKTLAENWFFPNPRGILVSTCAFGMGVDKPDIRAVIHRDCPPSVEAYLQESGRAGRDGKPAAALLLWGPEDEKLPGRANSAPGKKRREALLAYARDTDNCRRERLMALLDYEGSGDSPPSRCCDVCENKARGKISGKGFREERAILDFIKRNRRVYTLEEAALVLGKAKNLNLSGREGEALLKSLLDLGRIKKSHNPLWKNRLLVEGPASMKTLSATPVKQQEA